MKRCLGVQTRGSILILARVFFSLRTLGAGVRQKAIIIIIKILIFASTTKAPLKCIHLSSLVFFTTKFLAKCKTVIGEGCAAMVPWQDVRVPISAVLAAKRLDHFCTPFPPCHAPNT
jgi:hypothetical protein